MMEGPTLRPIKFRAWDGHTMSPVVSLLFGEDGSAKTIMVEVAPRSKYYMGKVAGENIQLMQFIGLRDKNGVEIYEGDIVRAVGEHINQYDGSSSSIDDIKPVSWLSSIVTGGNAFAGFTGLDYGHANIQLEVVGNIYENPELLGAE